MRPRAGWLSGFVANLITWQPATSSFLGFFIYIVLFLSWQRATIYFLGFFIYILIFLSFYLGSLQKLIFQDLYSFLFDISFRFCVYSIVIVGPIDHQLEDW